MAGPAEYRFSKDFKVTEKVLSDFNEYGFILLRNLFDGNEVNLLKTALEHDDGILKHQYLVSDGRPGEVTKLCLWNQPGNDITGMMARVGKCANTMSQLLGDEVYHYHTKLMMKESGCAGWNWHQDYGYWYYNGCLYPDMGTVFIAVDRCSKSNGCLQIIERSHKLGRVDHEAVGGQMGADMERVKDVLEVLPSRYVELEPGDGLFFHSNLLHTSSPNDSKERRWAFLVAYNTKHNNPTKEHHHPKYTRLDIVDDDSIYNCKTMTCMNGKDFLIPGEKSYGKHKLEENKKN